VAKRPIAEEDLLRIVFVSDPQMEPNGKSVLFTRKTIEKNKYKTALISVDPKGRLKEWTRTDLGASHGRWSLDGRRIAFFSKREGSASQIFLLNVKGGEAKPLTQMPEGDLGDFRWSPDGNRIAFTFRETHPDWTEEAKKKREEKGLSTPARIANNPLYRWDAEGFFLDRRHALFIVDVESGKTKKLYDKCPWGRYSFDWSPDGTRLAVKRSYQKNLWKDLEDDRILIVDLKGKATLLEGQPGGYKLAVRWSPDGKWIAYIGNPNPFDHRGIANAELFVAPAKGGPPLRLTEHTDYDLEANTLSDMGDVGGEFLEWLPNRSALLASVGWQGENQVAQISLNGELTFISKGKHVVSPGSVDRRGSNIGCLISDPLHPAEVAICEPKGIKKLTHFNDELLSEIEVCPPKEHWLEASDGYPVHAWSLQNARSTRSKGKPAVLEIHGGPQAQYGYTFFFEFQLLAAQGYLVAFSNPRGSKGYGKAHCDAISGHWGNKDWLDIEAIKNWMMAQPDIDPKKLGVMGGSYGGYMVNWVVGHTTEFRAAITDRCVSNLLAKSLNSDYPYYPGTYWQGSGYGPLEQNADLWRDSPLAYFDKVETPMLIIHSEGDLRCSIEQGEQVFTALQEKGIPSRFVRYPVTTSHGMSRGGPPDLRIHRLKEILNWWAKWLR
jgi:dipeptidyl aminopeptidase/acylaminoacyl peptidase